jgi:hypothetical protein
VPYSGDGRALQEAEHGDMWPSASFDKRASVLSETEQSGKWELAATERKGF